MSSKYRFITYSLGGIRDEKRIEESISDHCQSCTDGYRGYCEFFMPDSIVPARTSRRGRVSSEKMSLVKWANDMVQQMVADHVISKEQENLVSFGLVQGIRSVEEIGGLLLTGFCLNLFWQSIIILFAFIPLRVYAGGYHAKTLLQCIIKSWLLFIVVLLLTKYVPIMLWLDVLVLIVAGIVVWAFAPLEDVHKPLEEYEIIKYRRKVMVVFFIEIVLFFMGVLNGFRELSRCIVMGMFLLIVVIVLAVICKVRKDL